MPKSAPKFQKIANRKVKLIEKKRHKIAAEKIFRTKNDTIRYP